jgi:hypothetical protein
LFALSSCGEFSPNDLGPLHRQEDGSVHVVKRKTSSKSTGGFKFTNPFKRKKKQRKSGGGEADEEDALASYVANHLGAPALFSKWLKPIIDPLLSSISSSYLTTDKRDGSQSDIG